MTLKSTFVKMAAAVVVTIAICCCSDGSQKTAELEGAPAALVGDVVEITPSAAPTLGFEDASKWNGVNLINATHSEGSFSGEVQMNYWTEVSSIAISSIVGDTGDTVL